MLHLLCFNLIYVVKLVVLLFVRVEHRYYLMSVDGERHFSLTHEKSKPKKWLLLIMAICIMFCEIQPQERTVRLRG